MQGKWVSGAVLNSGAELLNVEHCDHSVSSAGWGEAVTPTPIVGWEPNLRGKTGARMVDLGPTMDPRRLASAAVDLNLRLMRWRAAPALDTARLAATKCLLLGAGTDLLSFARPCLQQRREQLSHRDWECVSTSRQPAAHMLAKAWHFPTIASPKWQCCTEDGMHASLLSRHLALQLVRLHQEPAAQCTMAKTL